MSAIRPILPSLAIQANKASRLTKDSKITRNSAGPRSGKPIKSTKSMGPKATKHASTLDSLTPSRLTSSTISLHLQCRVKPNVPVPYAGVTSVSESAIGVSVAAEPRDGQANVAVREIISSALRVPKSNISISQHTLKAREKLVVLDDFPVPKDTQTAEDVIACVRERFVSAIIAKNKK